MKKMIVAGDIGGTKTSIALYEKSAEGLKRVHQELFASQGFADFSDVVEQFLAGVSLSRVDAAAFGIAGPVIEGKCHTTNLPWMITTEALQKQLQTENIKLLNDLEATAYGMLCLEEDQFVSLNPNGMQKKANRAVIAAGTGLGEAMLYWDGSSFHPIGSEGGHCDFAPLTRQQDQLLKWLRNRYPSHVSIERILSGPGIFTLYQFLSESGFAPSASFMEELPEGTDPSAMVSKGALEYKDPLCMETLRLFAEIYGAEAGNLALKTLSLGGVYIGGGIAPKILPFLTDNVFLEAFTAKGRFETLLREIDVQVAMNSETALLGSANYAADHLL